MKRRGIAGLGRGRVGLRAQKRLTPPGALCQHVLDPGKWWDRHICLLLSLSVRAALVGGMTWGAELPEGAEGWRLG